MISKVAGKKHIKIADDLLFKMLKSNDKPAFSKIIINAIILKSLDIFIISGLSNPMHLNHTYY